MKLTRALVENLEMTILVGIAASLLFLDLIGVSISQEFRSEIIIASLALIAVHFVRDANAREEISEQVAAFAPTMSKLDSYL